MALGRAARDVMTKKRKKVADLIEEAIAAAAADQTEVQPRRHKAGVLAHWALDQQKRGTP